MIYPRIFSLSTVGILKHYVHDYLFHPLRTDFIGPNGVGKSVVADLLQLIFIYDTDLIKFGTDGVKQDERSIYKLPYKTSVAYCFLNIEVKKDKFLIIGIAIHSQVSVRIMPFLISNSVNPSKPIDELCLKKNEILLARDFLVDNRAILDIKTLAGKLLKEKGLYCNYFKTKDEVNKYYQFLYEKQILSINLSIGENLRAFAKVIQSFSKAKTLDLKPSSASKSLKQFLFEESDTELLDDYSSQQSALEKLLRGYSSLDKYIKQLEQKQQGLLQLKKLDNEVVVKKKEVGLLRVSECFHNLRQLKEKEHETLSLLNSEQEKIILLDSKSRKLPVIDRLIQEAIAKADDNYDLHTTYLENLNKSQHLENELKELEIIRKQKMPEGWKAGIEKIDIGIRSMISIKEAVRFITPIVKKYKSLSALEEARSIQQKRIQSIIGDLERQREKEERLISLLESSSICSLVQWIIRNNKQLSKKQEAAVMRFAAMAIQKTDTPTEGEKFIHPEELIIQAADAEDVEKKGFWLRLGPLSEFIEPGDGEPVFSDSAKMEKTITQLIGNLKESLQQLAYKHFEMDKVNNAKPFDDKIITEEFDLNLIEYSTIEKVKEGVACLLQLDEKIATFEEEKRLVDAAISTMLGQMPVGSRLKAPDLLKAELQTIRNRCQQRGRKFTKYETTHSLAIQTANDRRSRYESAIIEAAASISTGQITFDNQYSDYFKEFGENITTDQFIIGEVPLSLMEKAFQELQARYRLKYKELINRFEETQQDKSLPVSMEIEKESYSFVVLEQVLLGNKIVHTDNITDALNEANAGRISMAEDMKNSMVKIFDKTLKRYKRYKDLVHSINTFFKGRKISDRFYFNVDFSESKTIKIELLEDIGTRIRYAAKQDELAFDKPVSDFIEEFFKKSAHLAERMPIDKLLNPKTYFDLSVSLTDESRNEIPGSTGEAYSAIALLGIARLSLVQAEARKGLRFIILEEIGSLDNTNFSTFPSIAKEYGYQIITMSPQPYRTSLDEEWFAHHLIKGHVDGNINYHPSASYFKTKDRSQDLKTYLKLKEDELD